MKAKTGRKLEMGARALIFSRLHPDPSADSAVLLARLEDCLVRAKRLAGQQREGMIDSHIATLRKRDLLGTIRRAHLAHLRHVARLAALKLPEFPQRVFRLQRGAMPYGTFRTAAHYMVDEALSQKDVLVKHGLSEAVLESLTQALAEFDQEVERGNRGRLTHIGASFELDRVADEVVEIVRALDGPNLVRFSRQDDLRAGWQSASHVVRRPRSRGDVAA